MTIKIPKSLANLACCIIVSAGVCSGVYAKSEAITMSGIISHVDIKKRVVTIDGLRYYVPRKTKINLLKISDTTFTLLDKGMNVTFIYRVSDTKQELQMLDIRQIDNKVLRQK